MKNSEIFYLNNKSVMNMTREPGKGFYDEGDIKVAYINENSFSQDLYLYYCGIEQCKPGQSCGPITKDHYLIHFIFEGEGKFFIGDKVFNVSKKQGFLISPNVVAYYESSRDNPWKYAWIGFHGLNVQNYLLLCGLSSQNPVFHIERSQLFGQLLKKMVNTCESDSIGANMRLQGLLYLLFSELMENAYKSDTLSYEEGRKYIYIKEVMNYIQFNYMHKVTIKQIADSIGLNRSYMFKIFKNLLNVSPQQFLKQYRINKACELMKKNQLNITELAREVGLEEHCFRRFFKSEIGMTPSEYKKKHGKQKSL